MERVFEKICYVSEELDRMQNFLNFVKKVHEKADCKTVGCDVKSFLEQMEDIFNEELSYDARRIEFTEVCIANISVFSAMFQIHHKHQDCMDNAIMTSNF